MDACQSIVSLLDIYLVTVVFIELFLMQSPVCCGQDKKRGHRGGAKALRSAVKSIFYKRESLLFAGQVNDA